METDLLKDDCTLRRVCVEDEGLMLGMRNQDHVRMQMVSSDIISEEQHQKWFARMLSDNSKHYFVFEYKGQPAGIIGFFGTSESCADWSFYLGQEDLPKGLGTIMCMLGLEYIFEKSSIDGIETQIKAENKASQKIHNKLGFSELPGGAHENLVFRLTRDDWNKQ